MSQALNISDEEYTRLEQAAKQQGSSIADLVHTWIASINNPLSPDEVRAAQARWATLSARVTPPTEQELQAHPLLGAAGLIHSGVIGWADRHDEPLAEEALETHANE
jgi:hypothetical protein